MGISTFLNKSVYVTILVLFISIQLSAQCPDIVNVSYSEECIFLNWSEDAPPIPPFDLVYNNKLYSYVSGDGDSTAAVYSSVDSASACDINDDGFTGVLLVDGEPCVYLGGAPDPEPLPVSLISFKAVSEGQTVKLNWSTAYEFVNREFLVQRHGTYEWQTIATVAGRGNYDAIANYQALDKSPYTGLNMYRLVQVDHDGTQTLSEVVSVTVNSGNKGIVLSPNPASSHFELRGVSEGKINLYSIQGGQINSWVIDRNSFDISSIPSGMYLVEVIGTDGTHQVERLVVR